MIARVLSSPLPVPGVGLFLLVFTFAGAVPLSTQQTATLSGTLTDSTGAPVEGASVALRNTGSNESRQLSTDAIGHYTFTLLQAGSFEVSGEKAGLKQSTRQGIDLAAGQAAIVDLRLTRGRLPNRLSSLRTLLRSAPHSTRQAGW
jgi:hypothetical protein